MPLTKHYQQQLEAPSHRTAPMDMITTTLPIREGSHVVAELTVHVRPCFDQAFSDPYMASDVFFEDMQEHRLSLFGSRKRAILAEIKRDQPLVWAEIEAAAHSPLAA